MALIQQEYGVGKERYEISQIYEKMANRKD
jgi:hypothetical protein